MPRSVNQAGISAVASGQEEFEDVRARFQQASFEIAKLEADAIEVRKNGCRRILRRDSNGVWALAGPPNFIVRGMSCELEDRGYQKFWYSNGKRFPARQTDLKTLHSFDEETRALLGVKSLYHEALGSTSARTVYDRLRGRPDK